MSGEGQPAAAADGGSAGGTEARKYVVHVYLLGGENYLTLRVLGYLENLALAQRADVSVRLSVFGELVPNYSGYQYDQITPEQLRTMPESAQIISLPYCVVMAGDSVVFRGNPLDEAAQLMQLLQDAAA